MIDHINGVCIHCGRDYQDDVPEICSEDCPREVERDAASIMLAALDAIVKIKPGTDGVRRISPKDMKVVWAAISTARGDEPAIDQPDSIHLQRLLINLIVWAAAHGAHGDPAYVAAVEFVDNHHGVSLFYIDGDEEDDLFVIDTSAEAAARAWADYYSYTEVGPHRIAKLPAAVSGRSLRPAPRGAVAGAGRMAIKLFSYDMYPAIGTTTYWFAGKTDAIRAARKWSRACGHVVQVQEHELFEVHGGPRKLLAATLNRGNFMSSTVIAGIRKGKILEHWT